MGTEAPMLLDGVSHADASKIGRWGYDANIDSLPYADELPEHWKDEVEKEIRLEMRRSTKTPKDYLAELPPFPPTRFPPGSLIDQELKRVGLGASLAPMDQTRFRLDPPALNRRNDVNAWKQALNNAHSQLEHQALRLTNLELLFKYGANAWKANLNHLEASTITTTKVRDELKSQIEAMNQERKLQQEVTGLELKQLQEEWMSLLEKNMHIAEECAKLEVEIEELKREEEATGPKEEVMEEA
uniref:Pre-mRNA-splicing factor SPF27 n=1 Tax=Pyramimonas obovata TaxID=1411642 RepID=A0A7S0MSM4_9CHLO|mmetsp:Transcript_1256/g.2507  ORF Transcript_1256/g.2507 Transcript_1256/m.2507 type:complete len:243 (+) Transcript_1256:101-829(+)|eukprot:CAMPEP_0118934734 /NCGR_PEP_ID=MMETSP1169-20130426/14014_1 /TAXON_ID=36882 /ORGANISM="Pyramimonas obovata, Strain CCMP722" /LENGTH=242 /DNA_ID=CAMNT_0006877667 /DNA_START=91 /DNA_END=819 /DNA_ORIENTATION=+